MRIPIPYWTCLVFQCTYINGSPQNTFVPGCIELAEKKRVFIAGDDFKSGQTKLKSVLVDFLVSAGIKPVSIVSYNHLGNNDGYNLSAPQQFRSKEVRIVWIWRCHLYKRRDLSEVKLQKMVCVGLKGDSSHKWGSSHYFWNLAVDLEGRR